MPKYFCEYCGIYLTHSSPGGRKQHAKGKKHIENKIKYYSQFLFEFQRIANSQGTLLYIYIYISIYVGYNPHVPPGGGGMEGIQAPFQAPSFPIHPGMEGGRAAFPTMAPPRAIPQPPQVQPQAVWGGNQPNIVD